MNDEKSVFETLSRFTKVGAATSSLAFKLAGQKYLGLSLDTSTHASSLKEVLGAFKGPVMKVAQFLSMVPDALPKEYAEEFLTLQSQAPSMGPVFVKRRLQGELGVNWQEKFSSFDLNASAAASLGQVHKAVTLNSQQVACKLQYPQMESALTSDLAQLKIALSLYESFFKALETQNVFDEIKERLLEELDYSLEAKNCKMYQAILKDAPFECVVPDVFEHLSTKRLLTLSWIEGQSLLNVSQTIDGQEKNHIAQQLFKAWYYPFYKYGVIHGDPHPGNYLYTPDKKLALLDFGCVRVFKPSFVKAVVELYRALLKQDKKALCEAFENWGFTNLSTELIEAMTMWANLLFEPLLDDRVRPLKTFEDGKKGWDVATNVHALLKKHGGIKPPKEFVFMDRAAVGIGSMIMKLDATCNWHQLFEELLENFSKEAVAKRQENIRA